jgi:hypothetical protein
LFSDPQKGLRETQSLFSNPPQKKTAENKSYVLYCQEMLARVCVFTPGGIKEATAPAGKTEN